MRRDNGIEVEGLVREFKKGPRAVDGIDLSVAPGEIYGFLGPNGAGKSTTVHMLTTLLPPTAGTARVAGHDIVKRGPGRARRDRRRPAGGGARPVPDRARAHAPAGRDARDPASRGAPPRRRADRAGRPLRGRRPQGRRLLGRDAAPARPRAGARARARGSSSSTSRRPASTSRAAPRSGTRSRASPPTQGVTVFLTTQYLEEADALADRVGIIDTGKIVAEGTPDALKAEIGRPDGRSRAGRGRRPSSGCAAVLVALRPPRRRQPAAASPCASTRAPSELAEVVRALDAEGITVANLEIHAPTLDDVFLAKTGTPARGRGRREAECGELDRRARGRAGVSAAARHARPQAARARAASGTLSQVGYLAQRSMTRTLRQPTMSSRASSSRCSCSP